MEFLTQDQLAKYEQIISQMENEHLKSQRLKKDIEVTQNRLIISKCKKQNVKIGHVNVKIFISLFKLYNLYSEEIHFRDLLAFQQCENSKFYLLEVYVTSILLKMIETLDCHLNISIKSDNFYFCKTVVLKDKSSVPFFVVVPVTESVIDCQVFATLVCSSNDVISCINLDIVNVDVSYHLEMPKRSAKMSISRKLLEITKQYSKDSKLSEIHRPLMMEYEFSTTIDEKLFAQIVLKNCYHKIDLELFSGLRNESQSDILIQLLIGVAKCSLSFDRSSKIIKIKSNFEDLCRIKQYLCEKMPGCGLGTANLERKILEFKTTSRTQLSIDELRTMYSEFRKLWGTLF